MILFDILDICYSIPNVLGTLYMVRCNVYVHPSARNKMICEQMVGLRNAIFCHNCKLILYVMLLILSQIINFLSLMFQGQTFRISIAIALLQRNFRPPAKSSMSLTFNFEIKL